MLVWARESLGMMRDAAAAGLGIAEAKLAAWESEEPQGRPSIAQLRKLADFYRRPLAAFFLPEPPPEPRLVADFRRLPGAPRQPSPGLTLELRRAAARREIVIELAEDLGEAPPKFALDAGRGHSPEAVARLVRGLLGIDAETQRGQRDAYAALRRWRRAVEAQGALVFQISGVDVGETRGFSCFHELLPLIAINSADAPVARIFTLAHELGHLVRHTGAVCDLAGSSTEEAWCNRFAGELLVPATELQAIVQQMPDRREWPDHELNRIARAFWVSAEVVLRRLVAIDRASSAFYERWRARHLVVAAARVAGPVPVPNRLLSSAGTTFVSLVLSAFHADRISASTLAGYLGVKFKHLKAIESLVTAEAS